MIADLFRRRSCDAVDRDREEGRDVVPENLGPPVCRDGANGLNKMLAEKVGMVLLRAAIAYPAADVCLVFTPDGDLTQTFPCTLEILLTV